jgi:hypothetical protein
VTAFGVRFDANVLTNGDAGGMWSMTTSIVAKCAGPLAHAAKPRPVMAFGMPPRSATVQRVWYFWFDQMLVVAGSRTEPTLSPNGMTLQVPPLAEMSGM